MVGVGFHRVVQGLYHSDLVHLAIGYTSQLQLDQFLERELLCSKALLCWWSWSICLIWLQVALCSWQLVAEGITKVSSRLIRGKEILLAISLVSEVCKSKSRMIYISLWDELWTNVPPTDKWLVAVCVEGLGVLGGNRFPTVALGIVCNQSVLGITGSGGISISSGNSSSLVGSLGYVIQWDSTHVRLHSWGLPVHSWSHYLALL